MIAILLIAGAPKTPSLHIFSGVIPFLWTIKLLVSCFIIFFITRIMSSRIITTRLPDLFEWSCLVLIFIDLYVFNIKAFLSEAHFFATFPGLVEMALILIYVMYILLVQIMFCYALASAGIMAKRDIRQDLATKVKFILPAVIPYLFVSLFAEVFELLDFTVFNHFKDVVPQGVSFILTLFILVLIIPFFIRKIWGCIPLEQGVLRNSIKMLLAKSGVSFRDVLVWPLAGSRACTAAVVGLFPGFRYLMLTRCLMDILAPAEIEAVVAHEVAHVKRMHLWWQFALLAGYALLVYSLAEPAMQWLFSHKIVIKVLLNMEDIPFDLTSFVLIMPFILFFILYFRFFMGYFIRNFEREADMAVFELHGHPYNLISAFEKIAFLSGNIRNEPNWHHFSIGQRIEFLRLCYVRPEERKFFTSSFFNKKIAALGCISLLIAAAHVFPVNEWSKEQSQHTIDNTVSVILEEGGDNPVWYLLAGQLLSEKGFFEQAASAYQKAYKLAPESPDVLNDYAWFLVTTQKNEFRDYELGLQFAKQAVEKKQAPHILDTLAEAYFANGLFEQAIQAEQRAIALNPENPEHYRKQILKFEAATAKKESDSITSISEQAG